MKNPTGKRLYLNADRSKVVEEDSADAAYLLATAEGDVSEEDVARYGLAAAETPETKAEAPVADKAVEKPADKAADKAADKPAPRRAT